MQYNFVIIRTEKGGKYARKILNSIEWLNDNKYPQHDFNIYNLTINEFLNNTFIDDGELNYIPRNQGGAEGYFGLNPEETIIHARCANPRTEWTIKLRELEEMGYKVVNSVDTIELTSNKLACSLHLQGKVNHPKSWEYRKDMSFNEFKAMIMDLNFSLNYPHYFIAKPLTSLEQGANVRKILQDDKTWEEIIKDVNQVPGNKIVIQEYIPYTALHRVIVIGGKALPYTFIDKPEWHTNDWKVSCCLNRTTMKLNENADPDLLELAERTQKEVGGVINFIDIFEVDTGEIIYYTNAEINTACSLNIHEKLAKQAGRLDWNIHSRIAKELIKQLGV